MEALHYNFSTSCVLCYKFLDTKLLKKRLPDDDFAYFSSCTKFLSSEDLGESFSKEWSPQCPFLFCQKCLVCVQELSRLNSALQRIQTKIHQLVHKFRLSFLQDRGNNILEQEVSRSENEHQSFSGGEHFSIHEWPNNISEDNPIQITNCNSEESAVGEHHVLDENYNDNTENYNAINGYVRPQNDFDGEMPETTVKVESEEFFEPDEPHSPSFQFCDYETGNDGDLVEQKPDVTKSIVLKQVANKNVSKRRIQKKGNEIPKKSCIESLEDRKHSLRKSLPRRSALKAAKLFVSFSNEDDSFDDNVEDDAKSDISEESSFQSDSSAEPTGTPKRRSTNSGNIIKCKYCKLVFSTASELKAHIPSHDEERPFACDKCDLRFTTERFMRIHKWKHFDEKIFKCGHCKHAYKYLHSFKDHLKTHGRHHKNSENCNVCDVAKAKGREILLKKKMENGILPKKDPKPREIKSKPKKQKQDKEGESKRKHPCAECDKSFRDKMDLFYHTYTHQPPGTEVKCNKCDEVFTNGLSHKKHNLSVHRKRARVEIPRNDKKPKSLQCPICGMVLKGSLKRHMARHSGVRKFSCPTCEKTFKTKIDLGTHMLYHQDRPYLCEECGQGFHRGHKLKQHYRIHTGNLIFCPHCPKGFTTNTHLKQHLRVHNKDTKNVNQASENSIQEMN